MGKNFYKFLYLNAYIILNLLVISSPASASLNPLEDREQGTPVVLCLPGVYPTNPGDCTPAGPSAYLTQMAQKGISFPLIPLPGNQADPTLVQVDINYGEVTSENAPVYASIDDALQGNKKLAIDRINASFAYISYKQSHELDGKRLYNTNKGWMKAADVSRIGVLPRFQGMEFNRTPSNSFGWVLPFLSATPVETKRTPGNQISDYIGHILGEYEVVQIYDSANVDGAEWYLVGPEEWLPNKVVARVTPDITPPEGVSGDRWIEVNLDQQTIAVYDQRQLVFATVIASGLEPFWTRPGLFQIYEKHESTPMRGAFEADASDAYYLEDVPWTMYFDDARALHGAYWRTKMGFTQSHGCVNMTVGDAHWIFNWANIGDWVYVWDPSGRTPTDPSLYSSGGY